MLTIALCWYALGWAGVGAIALYKGKLSAADLLFGLGAAPAFPILALIPLLARADRRIVWRKP